MDDLIEELLLRQGLRSPSSGLRVRVRRELAKGARRQRLALLAAVASLAVGVLVAAWFGTHGSGTEPTPDAGLANQAQAPDESQLPTARVPVDEPSHPIWVTLSRSVVRDEGVIFLKDDLPVRRYRRYWIERTVSYDPVKNLRIESSGPHEQLVLVKAETY